jgi:hypothetical protein
MNRKSLLVGIIALFMLPLTSCNLSASQGKVVAQNAGLASAVTWIAYDNPEDENIQIVRDVLGLIKDVSADTSEGATYTQIIFPAVEDYLDDSVLTGDLEPHQKPLALAGSLALLNGIDLLFATNPQWAKNAESARGIVDSFILGAETGLSLAANDPRMVNARNASVARARVFNK